MTDFQINYEQGAGNSSMENSPFPQRKKGIKDRVVEFFKNPKKRLVFLICLGIVIIGTFSLGLYFLTNEKNSAETTEAEQNQTADNGVRVQAPLDGVMADEASANRHPLAVIVENHSDARPQAGLEKASVVYEALAEGGITRFLAVFGTNQVEKVGPIRSARTYFVDWAHGYNSYLAHVGGNMDALEKIPADKVLDLDQFKFSGPYWRERKAGLAEEHTMYSSTSKLWEQAEKNNYTKANNFNVFKFKDDPKDAEKEALPASQNITIDYSNPSYNVSFEYDKATNSYKRNLAGKPHLDQLSKNQIISKNLIVMTVAKKSTITKINETGWAMTTVGSGKAEIFLDGKKIAGTWKKESNSARELFYDEAGNEITFNRGQFWICVVPPETKASVN